MPQLATAIRAADFEPAAIAAIGIRAQLGEAHRAAENARLDAAEDLAALEREAEPLLVTAPNVSDQAYRERFYSVGRPRLTWDAEKRDWLAGKGITSAGESGAEAAPAGASSGELGKAERGIAGPSSPLPHLDRIQASFGRHDVSGILAHTDGAAHAATGELGATAYAYGDDVAFGGTADLFTAAHEAAHVIQQRAGVAMSGGTSSDVYEQHADQVAHVVVAGGSAERLLDVHAGRGANATPTIQRKSGGTKSPPALSPPSWEYCNTYRQKIWSAILDRIDQVGLPKPHPRITFFTYDDARLALNRTFLDDSELFQKTVLHRLMELVYQVDLYSVVDEIRQMPDPKEWHPEVGVAIATAFSEPLDTSAKRMGLRMRVQLDAHYYVTDVPDLVTSCPLDVLVERWLKTQGVVAPSMSPKKDSKVDDTQGKEFLHGAQPVTEFEWVADPKLWNWIHVKKPSSGVTVEDVAITPLHSSGGVMGTEQAYRIAASPPYFGIPIEVARQIDEARHHATGHELVEADAGDISRVAESSAFQASSTSDGAALAQAPKAPSGTPDLPRLLDRVETQLNDLQSTLGPWETIAVLFAHQPEFLARRRAELAKEPKSAAKWIGAIAVQERVLHAVASEVGAIVDDLKDRKVKPGSDDTPHAVGELMFSYARAAAASHLAAEAGPLLAKARTERALLPLSLTEDQFRGMQRAVADQRFASAGATQSERDADANVAKAPELATRLADLRLKIMRGDRTDAKEQERLTTEGAELGMRARLATLAASVRSLMKRGDDVGLTHDPDPGGGWSIHMLGTMILDLIYRGEKPHAQSEDPNEPHGGWLERLDIAKKDIHDPARTMAGTVAKIDKEMSTILNLLGGWNKFKEWVLERIHDQEVRNLINSVMLQVGLMIVTGEIAGAGLAAIRGIALAGEIATDVRGAGLLWKGAEIITHAGLQTVAGGAVGGEISGRAFAENALGMVLTSAAMKPFHALLHGSEALEGEVIRTWGQLAKKSAKVGTELVLSTGTGILASGIAHSIVHNGELSVAGADEWTTQGISLAASMFVSSRTAGMHQRMQSAAAEYGTKDFRDLMKRTEDLARLAQTKSPTREEVRAMLEERQSILIAEKAALAKLGGRSKGLIADNAAEIHDTAALAELPLQLAGLSSVVDGHAYEGTAKQIREALEHGDKFGVKLAAKQDPLTGVWTVESGGRRLTVRELDFKRHTANSASGVLRNTQSLGGNRYGAPAMEMRELYTGHANDPDAHATPLRYDAMRNVTYYEADVQVGGRRERLHIEAKLAQRITSFSELASTENAVIGHQVSLTDGLTIIERLNRGDASALASVGLAVTGKLPGGNVEFGLGLTVDGTTVVVRGSKTAEVDWTQLPGLKPIAHTHPDVVGNNLPIVDGERSIRIADLLAKADLPSPTREKIFPSGGDVITMFVDGVDGHLVHTPFIVKHDKVMKAPPGDSGPRLVFKIGRPAEDGFLTGHRTYKWEITGLFDGDAVIRHSVWTVEDPQSATGGHHLMQEPAGMLPKAKLDRAASAAKTPKTPAHIDLTQVGHSLETAARKSLGSAKHEPFTVEALSAEDFKKRFRSDKGNAVFKLEDEKVKIFVHEAATENDVIAEMYHLRQLSDPKLGAEIRHLYGSDLGNWDSLSVADRLEIFRRKLVIEIASHEMIVNDPHASNDLKMTAAAQLADLHGMSHQVDALTPEALSRLNARLGPMPEYLVDPAYLFNKRRDPNLAAQKTNAHVSTHETAVTDSTASKRGASVVQTGDTWQERWQITSGYDGVLTFEMVAGEEVAVITTSTGARHVYDIENNGKRHDPRSKRSVKSGDVLIDEQTRNYRRVKITEPGKAVYFTQEIQVGVTWRERGSEISKNGALLEDAAKLQIDKQLDDAGATHKRVPHQAADGTGFDDVVAIFEWSGGSVTGARLRIREVKNYPGRYVPLADFTAIRDNLETNMTRLEESIDAALENRGADFKGWREDQLKALRQALRRRAVDFEVVIGPDTLLGDTGAANSVLDQLRKDVGKYGQLMTMPKPNAKPGSNHGEATRVGQDFVDKARDVRTKTAGKVVTP